jgi:hypothetical protein
MFFILGKYIEQTGEIISLSIYSNNDKSLGGGYVMMKDEKCIKIF